MAHINASIVKANVSNAFALYPNECILLMSLFFFFDRSGRRRRSLFPCSLVSDSDLFEIVIFIGYFHVYLTCVY